MPEDPGYTDAVNTIVGRLRATIPENLIGEFRAATGISADNFRTCRPSACGEVCAIDGSDVLLMESGSMALAVFRAAQSTFRDNERGRRSGTDLKFAVIGPGRENRDFPDLYLECFGEPPGNPLGNEDRSKAAGILRDTLEFWVMERMAGDLAPGALLLRDGPLRVSHASHDIILTRILRACEKKKVDLAGISKRTTATWGGGHSLLPSVSGLAKESEIPAPWSIRINPEILDRSQFPQWRHGETFVACLHSRAKSPLKIDSRQTSLINRLPLSWTGWCPARRTGESRVTPILSSMPTGRSP